MFHFDETMLAANFEWKQGDSCTRGGRVQEEAQEAISLHSGWGFQPFGTWPLIVVPIFSGAEELFVGHDAFVRESLSQCCTGSIFAAFAEHFCGLVLVVAPESASHRVSKRF
jgi:hypothetical protein